MKIVAFAGSSSTLSINKALVKYTLTFFPDADVQLLDLNDFQMPIYSADKEKEAYPEQAYTFLKIIEQSDAIICSLAEHNGNFTAAFKNIFDWTSRINRKIFQDKPMLLMATSPGEQGGKNVLEIAQKSFPRFGGNIQEVFSLPKFEENFSIESGILNAELKEKHLQAVNSFKEKNLLEK